MSWADSLFDSFYNKFILRDVFAKITPGLILIFTALFCFYGSIHEVVYFLEKLSVWQWLLLPLAWIMGFFLQHLGLMSKWLKDPTYTLSKSNKEEDKKKLAERFERKVRASLRDEKGYSMLLERAIIIKETCGNFSMAMIFVGVAFFAKQVRSSWQISLIVLVISIFIAFALKESHKFQSIREEGLREAYAKLTS